MVNTGFVFAQDVTIERISFTGTAGQELNDPFSYALFGNSGKMKIKEDVTISGDIFQNGDVEIKKDARVINGQFFATGNVTIKKDANVSQGVLTDPLPQFPEFDTGYYDNLLAHAQEQPEEDKTFKDITLEGDTLFINGKITLKEGCSISGPGVIVATKDIKIKEGSSIGPGVILISSKK